MDAAILSADKSTPAVESIRLRVGGMTCATCATRIEKVLRKLPEVQGANVSLAEEVATVAFTHAEDSGVDGLLQSIEKAGFTASVDTTDKDSEHAREVAEAKAAKRELLILIGAAVLTAPLIVPMLLMPFGIHWMIPGGVQLLLATPVQIIAGATFYKSGYRALRGGSANMDVLVVMGTSAAFLLSTWLYIQGSTELYF